MLNPGEKLRKMYAPQAKVIIEEYYRSFMRRLVDLRQASDPHNRNVKNPLTQHAVAEALEMFAQNYSKLERGKKNGGINLSIEHAIRLATLYGCSIDWLITGRETPAEPIRTHDSVSKEIKLLESSLESERKLSRMLEAENYRLRDEIAKLKTNNKPGRKK